MRVLVVVLAVVCAVAARPDIGLTLRNQGRGAAPAPGKHIAILRQAQDVGHDGTFQYSFDTENGISVQESGSPKGPEILVVQGSYSYTAPDGTPITVTYIADENGYRAEGAHLPVAPPIPEAILKSIEFNRANGDGEQQQQQRQQPNRRF